MKTKSSPSRYRNVIPRLSTVAVSTFVPALKVRSTTLPDSTFFSVVRTKAPPLPGLTCWNWTTAQSWPSRSSTMPFLRSLVVATSATAPRRSKDHEVLGGGGQEVRLGAVADHEGVLDPDSAAPGEIDPWLDGDGHPIGQCTGAEGAQRRCLVDLQADAVAETVQEGLAVAAGDDHVPGGGVDRADVRAGRQRLPAGLLRRPDQLVDLLLPTGRLTQHQRAGHVRVVAADGGAEVELDQVAALQHPVHRPVMRHRRVRAGRHDRLERAGVRAELQHPGVQVAADLPLGAPGPQPTGLD